MVTMFDTLVSPPYLARPLLLLIHQALWIDDYWMQGWGFDADLTVEGVLGNVGISRSVSVVLGFFVSRGRNQSFVYGRCADYLVVWDGERSGCVVRSIQ
jgi:hypothetical protein